MTRLLHPACQQGHEVCTSPQICREAQITAADHAAIRQHAEGRAARQARQLAEHGTASPVVNPHPRYTRRNVLWTSYFLEEQLRLELIAEHQPGENHPA